MYVKSEGLTTDQLKVLRRFARFVPNINTNISISVQPTQYKVKNSVRT